MQSIRITFTMHAHIPDYKARGLVLLIVVVCCRLGAVKNSRRHQYCTARIAQQFPELVLLLKHSASPIVLAYCK